MEESLKDMSGTCCIFRAVDLFSCTRLGSQFCFEVEKHGNLKESEACFSSNSWQIRTSDSSQAALATKHVLSAIGYLHGYLAVFSPFTLWEVERKIERRKELLAS